MNATLAIPLDPERDRSAAMAAAAVALAAVWIGLSRIHVFHHGDSLVPVLMSLQRWTPYYWEQDRLGALLPLVASPVRHPFWNLIVQYTLSTAMVLGGFFVLARAVVNARRSLWAGTLAVCAVVATVGMRPQFDLFMGQHQYGTSLILMGTGLCVWSSAMRIAIRVPATFIFWSLSCWLNLSIAFALVGWILAETAVNRRWREAVSPLAMTAVAFGVQVVLSRWSPHRDYYGFVSILEWPSAYASLVAGAWRDQVRHGWWLAWLLLLPAAVMAMRRRHWRGAVAPLGSAAAQFLFMGTLDSVRRHNSDGRYVLACCVLITLALAVPASRALIHLPIRRVWFAAAAVMIVVMLRYGSASPTIARLAIDDATGARTRELLLAEATHVVGRYWTVWPSVYHANLVLHERGDTRRVWGVTHRSWPTAPLWRNAAAAGARLARPHGEVEDADRWSRTYDLPDWQVTERRPGFDVLQWTSVTQRSGNTTP